MSRQMKGLLYFYITDIRFSLLVFWSVLLGSLLVSMLIDYFLMQYGSGGVMAFYLPIALYVYCGIFGFLAVKQSVPFSIKIGSTRKNIFLGMGIFFLGLSLSMSVLVNSIQSSIEFIHEKIGNETFVFMHLASFVGDQWLVRVLIDASFMIFLLSLFFLIGLTFYKYGLIGGGSFVALLVIIILSGFSAGWLVDFFIHIYETLSPKFFWYMSLVGLMIYGVTWIMLRNITIVSVR